jgi:hypothetical protein
MFRQAEFEVGEEDQDADHDDGEEKDDPGLESQGPLEKRGPSPTKIMNFLPDFFDEGHGSEPTRFLTRIIP